MKTLARVSLLALNTIISGCLILFGSGYFNITDANTTKSPLEIVIGLVVLSALLVLLFLGRSNKKAEKPFWYVGIGCPLILLILLFSL